ncbi:hypothetical protein B7494_g2612 [Chlorociboria aeruginascens]|nr:hypothetical protein B7494_g2612 [Chlorociboria aeruginascens]
MPGQYDHHTGPGATFKDSASYRKLIRAPVVDHLWFRIREDPLRVRIPVYNSGGNSIPTRRLSEIVKIHELGMGVYKVRVTSEKDPYVYKEVDNPLNEPRNSKVLEQELQDLELLRGTEGVVQLVAAVVSKNPYHTGNTIENDTSIVLRGILLGYYPNGTLQDALTLLKSKDLQFLRWVV